MYTLIKQPNLNQIDYALIGFYINKIYWEFKWQKAIRKTGHLVLSKVQLVKELFFKKL